MSNQWTEKRLLRETRDAVYDVVKRAGCSVRSMDIEIITPAESAAALKQAFEYRQMADRILQHDPIAADGYRKLAKRTLEQVGLKA